LDGQVKILKFIIKISSYWSWR